MNLLGIQKDLFVTLDKISEEFWSNCFDYLISLANSFLRGVCCICISTFLGVVLGILFSYFNKYLDTFENIMKFIWSIPLIAVSVYLNIFIPNEQLFIIINGAFLGTYPVLSFTYRKCLEQNEGILSLVASFNLSKKDEYKYFRIKEVIRNLVFPLAQSVPLVYIGVSMGEYTVGQVAGGDSFGLGSDFRNGINYSHFPKVYVTIILMVFLVFVSGEVFEKLIDYKVHNFKFKKFFDLIWKDK